jgi:hypothetical protein
VTGVNSAERRASVLGVIVPDGALGYEDRRTVLGVYGGWFEIVTTVAAIVIELVMLGVLVDTGDTAGGTWRGRNIRSNYGTMTLRRWRR